METPSDSFEEARALWRRHVETGEPLDVDEAQIVVLAELTRAEDWENRGRGQYWHVPTWPDAED